MLYIYINRMTQQIKNNKPLKTVNKCDCCCKSWRNNKAGGDTCNCSCSNCYELLRDCKYSCYVLKINKIEEVKPKEEFRNLMKIWTNNMEKVLGANRDMSAISYHIT